MTWEELIKRCPFENASYDDRVIVCGLGDNNAVQFFKSGAVLLFERKFNHSFFLPQHRTYEQMLMIMEALK